MVLLLQQRERHLSAYRALAILRSECSVVACERFLPRHLEGGGGEVRWERLSDLLGTLGKAVVGCWKSWKPRLHMVA